MPLADGCLVCEEQDALVGYSAAVADYRSCADEERCVLRSSKVLFSFMRILLLL